jgi:hypothetical protein
LLARPAGHPAGPIESGVVTRRLSIVLHFALILLALAAVLGTAPTPGSADLDALRVAYAEAVRHARITPDQPAFR